MLNILCEINNFIFISFDIFWLDSNPRHIGNSIFIFENFSHLISNMIKLLKPCFLQ